MHAKNCMENKIINLKCMHHFEIKATIYNALLMHILNNAAGVEV